MRSPRLVAILAVAVGLGALARRASAANSHLLLVQQNQTGNLLDLREVTALVDGAPAQHIAPGDPQLKQGDIQLLSQDVPPGLHTLSLVIGLEGRRLAVFSYLSGYKFTIRLAVEVNVEPGRTLEVASVAYMKSGVLLQFEERPAARFLIANSLSSAKGQSDRDGDGVADDLDECPDVPGSTIARGCPDKDGDGIPDKDDKCPTEPETKNGYQDEDGCPDTVPAPSTPPTSPTSPTSPDEPMPAEPPAPPPPPPRPPGPTTPESHTEVYNPSGITSKVVHFDFNVDKPRSRFLHALDQIARAMVKHPEIQRVRVEGHTDFVGGDEYNQTLSERRAQSVVAYLIEKGVAAERVHGVGFGKSRPRDKGTSATARARNRRVEFVIEQ